MSLTPAQIQLPPRYRVVRRIAAGGMASVYAAEDSVLDRPVAVKVLSEALGADESARSRFTREARAAARLSDHPNVVTIYDVGEHDGMAFIVMELLAGGTVDDRLKAGEGIPHGVALRWLEQTAAALDAAHAVDVVHRDVKPANLLLDAAGVLKVGDFGIATLGAESRLTATGEVIGTAAYFAPEQALGQPSTAASDRYSLAVVAFELLTGQRPFPSGPPVAQARAHIDSEPPRASALAPELSRRVDEALAHGMAKAPQDRPATAGAFVAELRDAVGPTASTVVAPTARFSRPVVAAAPPAVERQAPSVVRSSTRSGRSAAAIALGALILALGIVAAVLLGGGGSSDQPTAHRRHPATTRTHARTQTRAASTPAPTPPPPSKSALQQRAHALIDQGNYPAAISILQDLVKQCPVQITDPCAFAWYDLGHALRLAGQPAAAIPVLQARLQNPDQRDVVMQELQLAQQAAQPTPPPKKTPPGQAKHGHGPKKD